MYKPWHHHGDLVVCLTATATHVKQGLSVIPPAVGVEKGKNSRRKLIPLYTSFLSKETSVMIFISKYSSKLALNQTHKASRTSVMCVECVLCTLIHENEHYLTLKGMCILTH